MDLRQWFSTRLSRRRVIRNFGLLAGAGLSIDAGIFAASKVYAAKFVSNKPDQSYPDCLSGKSLLR